MNAYEGMTNYRVVSTDHLIRLCQWLKDINKGEMIECTDYTKHYLGFGSISQKELDALCQLANTYLCDYTSGKFISNQMGEIIPVNIKKGE